VSGDEQEATLLLTEAVRTGDVDGCRAALAAGANVNGLARDNPYWTVLHNDMSGNLVQLFLDTGVAFVDRDWTRLGVAAQAGNLAAVRLLLGVGDDPNQLSQGKSPLTSAIRASTRWPGFRTTRIVRLLIEAGARTGEDEEPPVVQAVLTRASAPIIRILLSGPGNVYERRRDGTPVLVLAAARNNSVAVTVLLRAGVQDTARDRSGRTALRHATEQGFTDIVTALLAAGTIPPTGHDIDVPLQTLPRSRGNVIPYAWKDDPVPPATALATWSAQPSVIRLTGSAEQIALLELVVSEAYDRMGDELRTVTGHHEDDFATLRDQLRDAGTPEIVPHTPQAGLRVTDGMTVELTAVQVDMLRQAALNIWGGAASWRTPLIERQVLGDLMDSLERISNWS
jgi:ankyrin repeat protein